MVRCLLLMAFLLGIWAQPASACQDTQSLHGPGHALSGITETESTVGIAVIGGEQRCECPAIMRGAEAIVSDASKLLLAFREPDSDSVLRRPDPDLTMLVACVRTESFRGRRAMQPVPLPVSRLRQ